MTLKYGNFGVLAVGAIKELKAEMDAIIEKQGKLITELQKRVKKLEK